MPNRLPHVLVLLAAVVLLTGCSRDLGPTTYTDEVKANYSDNCVKGATDKLTAAGADTYCQCTYNAFVASVSFSKFKDFESYLRQHVGDDVKTATDLRAKYPDISALFDNCVVKGPTTAGASVSTTIPTTVPTTTAAR